MPEELPAVPHAPPAAAPGDDYDAICEALMQSARGRWFLQEFARRNRTADTEILLAAIRRVEAVVCAERTTQTPHGFRSDLLEMAKAITRTRAEVAGIGPEVAAPRRLPGEAKPTPQSRDVFAAAERIRDVTWAMRGHGFDPSTCDQLEDLASSILSARALRDPADHRVSRLSEVLRYLEQRIGTLLHGEADAESASPTASAWERTPAATPLEEADGAAAPDGIAATSGSDATSDRVADDPRLAPRIEPGEPAVEGEANSPSGSAISAIEATDLASPSELEVAPESADENEGSVEVEVEAEPEVALAPEPVRLALTAADDTPVAATEPPEPLAEASASIPQPAIAARAKAADDGAGEIPPRQDSDLIRVAAVMRLAQVLFEAGSTPDAGFASDVELDGASEPRPAVPLAEAPPLRAEADHRGSDADFRPADWPADRPDTPFAEVPPSPVKPAWSVTPVPTTEIAQEPVAVYAIGEKPTAANEETMLPQLVLPPPRAPAIDTRDPLAALTAMSESELIALFS